jgi:exonuclease VII small subunit
MSDDRAPVYVEDGKVIYRASSVGMCDSALIAIRQGATPMMPPEWLLEKMQEGTDNEALIVEGARAFLHQGEVVSSQDEFEILVYVKSDGTKVVVRGHTDGMLFGSADVPFISGKSKLDYYGVEAKKLGPALYGKWERSTEYFFKEMPYYRDQLTLYMEAMGYEFLYAVGKWDPEEKRVEKVDVRRITAPPSDINVIKAKIIKVEAMAETGVMPVCEGTMYPCPVYYLHQGVEREEGDKALDEAVQAYLEALAAEKAAKKDKEEAFKLVQELMKPYKDKVETPLALVTRFESVSKRLDTKAARRAGLDLDPYYTETRKESVKITPKEAA